MHIERGFYSCVYYHQLITDGNITKGVHIVEYFPEDQRVIVYIYIGVIKNYDTLPYCLSGEENVAKEITALFSAFPDLECNYR